MATFGTIPTVWGHSALWTGSGAASDAKFLRDKIFTQISQQDAVLHNPTATGYILPGGSTPAACAGAAVQWHLFTRPLGCSSYVDGCSCVAIQILSKNSRAGILDADVITNTSASPSIWSGWQLEILSGPAAGYQGTISFASPGHYYVIPQLPAVQLDERSKIVISQHPIRSGPSSESPDVMWVFGGRYANGSLSNDIYFLNTNSSSRRAFSATTLLAVESEEFSISANDWQGTSCFASSFPRPELFRRLWRSRWGDCLAWPGGL